MEIKDKKLQYTTDIDSTLYIKTKTHEKNPTRPTAICEIEISIKYM